MVDETHMYKGFFDCLQKTVSQHGIQSLLQGASARVSWIGPFTAIYLPIYETLKRQMIMMESKPPLTSFALPWKLEFPSPHQPPKLATALSSIQGGAQLPKRKLQPWCGATNKSKTVKQKMLRLEGNECFVSF